MKAKDLKNIIKFVSTDRLIEEFILHKDGKVDAMSSDKTFLVNLKYNGIDLPEDIGIDDSKKIRSAISLISDETEIELKENRFYAKSKGTEINIPRRSIDTIDTLVKIPNFKYALEIQNVPLSKLQKGIKNKINDISDKYEFITENGILKIIVGDKETGWIIEEITSVPKDKNLKSQFSINIPQIIKTLEKDPTIKMDNIFPIEFSVTTDEYSVTYTAAPRAPRDDE